MATFAYLLKVKKKNGDPNFFLANMLQAPWTNTVQSLQNSVMQILLKRRKCCFLKDNF